MASATREVKIVLSFLSKDAGKAIKDVANVQKKLVNTQNQSNEQTKKAIKNSLTLSNVLQGLRFAYTLLKDAIKFVIGVMRQLYQAARLVIRVFVDVMKTYAEFEKIAASSAAIMKTDVQAVIEMSKETRGLGIGMKEAATGMGEFARAGFSANETFSAFPSIAMFAKAAQASLGQATTLTTAAIRAFGMTAEDTDRIVTGFTNAIVMSRNDFDSLNTAFGYAAAAGNAFEQSFEGVLASLMAFRNLGLQASTSGTVLRRVLSNLAKPSKDGAKALRDLGLTVKDVTASSTNSFAEIVRKLSEAGAGEDPNSLMAIVGKRYGAYMATLVKATSEGLISLEELENKLLDSTDTLPNFFQATIMTFSGQLSVAKANLETFWNGLAQMMEPFATQVMFIFNQAIEALMEYMGIVASSEEELTARVEHLMKSFDLKGKTEKVLKGVMESFKSFKNKFNEFFREFGMGIGIAGTIQDIIRVLNAFLKIGMIFVNGLLIVVVNPLAKLARYIVTIVSLISATVSKILAGIKILFHKIENSLKSSFNSILEYIVNLIDQYSWIFSALPGGKVLTDIANKAASVINLFKDPILMDFEYENTLKQLEDDYQAASQKIKSIFKTDSDPTIESMKKTEKAIKNLSGILGNLINKDLVHQLTNSFMTLGAEGAKGLKVVQQNLEGIAKKTVETADKMVKSVEESSKRSAQALLEKQSASLKPTYGPTNPLDKFIQEDALGGKLMQQMDAAKSLVESINWGDDQRGMDAKFSIMDKFYEGLLDKDMTVAKQQEFIDKFNQEMEFYKGVINDGQFDLPPELFEGRDNVFLKSLGLGTSDEDKEKFLETMEAARTTAVEKLTDFETVIAEFVGKFQSVGTIMGGVMTNSFKAVQNGFSKMLRTLIMGGESIKDIFKEVGKSILGSLMDAFAQILAQKLFMAIIGDRIEKKTTDKTIVANASKTFTGMMAWGSSRIGPAAYPLAEAMQALTQARGQQIAQSAGTGFLAGTPMSGAYGPGAVPGRDSVAASLSPGEIVLDNNASDLFRETVGGGGLGSNVNITFNISALDGESVTSAVKTKIMPALARQMGGDADYRRAMQDSLRGKDIS